MQFSGQVAHRGGCAKQARRAYDAETHHRCAAGVCSKGQDQRPERRIGWLGTIELDRRLELQGDDIGPGITPGDTGPYRRTVGPHDLGRVCLGEYLFGSDYQIVPPQGAAQRERMGCTGRDNRTSRRCRRRDQLRRKLQE